MADGSLTGSASLEGKVGEAEWNKRVELAALYRLVALHGWDDMIFTHISARLPGPDLHAAREDAQFVMHLHSDQGVAVSAQAEGLLPLSQHALIVLPRLAYHDYEGIALNHDERERIVSDLGDRTLMLLRNHGTLAVGETAAGCWAGMYYLERACMQQALALGAGRSGVRLAPAQAINEVKAQSARGMEPIGGLAWPGALRQLDRKSPGYAA